MLTVDRAAGGPTSYAVGLTQHKVDRREEKL